MSESSIIALAQNSALLLALVVLLDMFALNWRRKQVSWEQAPLGALLGGIGITIMLTPWVYTPGIVFDTRSVLLGISGLFFGAVPTLIAMLMTAAFRVYQGGAGTLTGICVILSSGMIGIAWRHFQHKNLDKMSWRELYLMGVVIHLVMLAWFFLLPWQKAIDVLAAISLPVLVIYPVGTALLGLLMVNRLQHEVANEELAESEERVRLAVNAANIGFFDWDMQMGRVHYSPEWKGQIGYADDEIADEYEEWEGRVHPDDLSGVLEKENACLRGEQPVYEAEFRLRHKDGSYRWILARGLLHSRSEARAARLVGCHIDITRQKQIEDAILASERRFRGLAESSQDYIMLYDRECRHVYMNRAGLQVSGFTEGDILGKTHREAGFSEELSDLWEGDILQVFVSGNSVERTFEWDSVQGRVYLDLHLSPVLAADGRVEWVLGISRDITALKQAEMDLKKSEELYRALTESIKDVVWILDAETMYFRYVSPSVERLRGYTPEEILARPVEDALTEDARQFLHDLIRGRVEAYLNGQEPPDKFYIEEVEQPCKDGSTVWTEVVTNYYLNPETGRVEVRGVSRDISERRRAEEELKRMADHYLALIENAPGGIVQIDQDGSMTYASPSARRIFGYSPDESLEELSPAELTHPEDLPSVNELLADLVWHPFKVATLQYRFQRKDGAWRWIESTFSNLLNAPSVGAIVINFHEITDRKLAEEKMQTVQADLQRLLKEGEQSRRALLSLLEDQKRAEEEIRQLNIELDQRVHDRTAQLQAANQELEAFAYSVSHDLRSPLRALDGFSAALLEDYSDIIDGQGQHYLTRIQEASRRMGQLINDLLNLSRVTRSDFVHQRVDLSALANEVANDLKSQDTRRQVEFEIAPGMIVHGDAHLLRIAMENLLNNAYKFTNRRKSAHITVGKMDQNGEKVYFVGDNGAGFNMAYANKLFTPFQRLHGAQEFPGTGIGLVTVQRIITRHGGRIWPEAAEDQGATFYFTLGGR